MNILIEIPTKDRDAVLGRCFAALLNQSYQDFDVLVLSDGDKKVGRTPETELFLNRLSAGRTVTVEDGSHISQAHNHNIALYDRRFRDYKYIIRLDDDVILNRHAVQNMFNSILNNDAAAVGGLWFEYEWVSERYHDGGIIEWNPYDDEATDGRVDVINNNWQQRMYHRTHELQEVQHMYSVCIYDADAMRDVGGWPEVYSKGVAHGEETDGTYRLHLAGYKMYVDPSVTGQHLKTSGGIRSAPRVGLAQSMDNAKWRARLPMLKKIHRPPTVAIWCQHAHGFGGAQRHFYKTINLLQSRIGLIVHPVFSGSHFSPEECQEAFGFSYREYERLEHYDIALVLGHQPFKVVEADHHILYTYFPDNTELEFDAFDLILTISKYSAKWVGEKWGYIAHPLYPSVKKIPLDPNYVEYGDVSTGLHIGEKEKIILVVSRADPYKAPLWLMEKFVEFDLEGWELHAVCATTEVFALYGEQAKEFAKEHDNVFLYNDISDEELSDLYRRAEILWHAKGIHSKTNPQEAEHFGMVPLEAWSVYCVPLVFDAGGHRETIKEQFRWSNAEELRKLTEDIIHSDEFPEPIYPEVKHVYNDEWYAECLTDWILRVNGMALELQKVPKIEVENKKIRVAAIADSPHLTTGFGIVANEIYKRIVKDKDLELCVFGIMDTEPVKPFEAKDYAFYPAPGSDLQGRSTLPKFIKWARPDVVWELYDPGNVMGHIMAMKALGQSLPWVAYFPIEGERITKEVYRLVNMIDYPVTYCNAGSDAILKIVPDAQVYVAYHGADHADFKPLEPNRRRAIRKLIGWEDKFVIFNNNSNKRVKQQPYLIETMRILLERGHDDVYMYFHTRAFDDHLMQGWDLEWIADHDSAVYGQELSSHILYPMKFANKWKGTPWSYDDHMSIDTMTMPPTPQGRGALFNGLDYITRFGLADMYVDVSSAEGWGLAPLEAVACGVPTISVDDGMVRSEVHSKYCHMVKPVHWTTWHTGSILQLVDPVDVADTIEHVMETDWGFPNTVIEDLPWEDTATLFIDLIKTAYRNK